MTQAVQLSICFLWPNNWFGRCHLTQGRPIRMIPRNSMKLLGYRSSFFPGVTSCKDHAS